MIIELCILSCLARALFVLRTRILSRFTPSGFLALRSNLSTHENFQIKISVSQLSGNVLKHIEMQKNPFLPPMTHYALARSGKRKQQTATLLTPCQSQGPKECTCQVSCRLVQNCGR